MNFHLKMHQNCLVTGLCLDPLGELTVLPPTSQLALSAGASRSENEGRERGTEGGRKKWQEERRVGVGRRKDGNPRF